MQVFYIVDRSDRYLRSVVEVGPQWTFYGEGLPYLALSFESALSKAVEVGGMVTKKGPDYVKE